MAPVAVQTSYPSTMERGANGQIQGMDWDTIHRNCETEAGIPFGRAVGRGVADGAAVLGGPLADFLGVSVRDITQIATDAGANSEVFAEGRELSVLKRGLIMVLPAVNVSEGDAVHYDATTGVFSNTGGNGPIKGAEWYQSGNANQPTRLYLGGVAQNIAS